MLLTSVFEYGRLTELPEHSLVNGYANGWYVPRTGQYRIVLEFWPQRLLEIGILISAMTLIACLTFLIITAVRVCRARFSQNSSERAAS